MTMKEFKSILILIAFISIWLIIGNIVIGIFEYVYEIQSNSSLGVILWPLALVYMAAKIIQKIPNLFSFFKTYTILFLEENFGTRKAEKQ